MMNILDYKLQVNKTEFYYPVIVKHTPYFWEVAFIRGDLKGRWRNSVRVKDVCNVTKAELDRLIGCELDDDTILVKVD